MSQWLPIKLMPETEGNVSDNFLLAEFMDGIMLWATVGQLNAKTGKWYTSYFSPINVLNPTHFAFMPGEDLL